MDSALENRHEGVDWERIHLRLEASRRALEARLHPGPDQIGQILHARAKLLAREADASRPSPESLHVIDFLLANEHYGIESHLIREIHPLKGLWPVPCTPPHILGLIYVRGQILCVLDIKKLLELPDKGFTDLNRVLVLESDGIEVGILADAVVAVRSVALQDLQPGLPTLTGIRAEYVTGVTREPMVVLNIGKLLLDKKIVVDEE